MNTQTAQRTDCKPSGDFSECFYLGDYERNGYDDSDFFVVFWDDKAGQVEKKEYCSTRYGGSWDFTRDLQMAIPTSVALRIRANIYHRALEAYTKAEIARTLEPQPESLRMGTKVAFIADSTKRHKATFKKGETAEVLEQAWFGTFYRSGYNSKGRHNGRARIRTTDGRAFWCAMTALRLAAEPDLAAAEAQAREESEQPHLTCPGGWWTRVNEIPTA